MKIVADIHLHSYYSRATSKTLNLENLHKWAQLKGVTVVGTGDIAHPGWLAEMREKLQPAEQGLFRLKPELARTMQREVFKACEAPVRFMLAGEISNIYKRHDKVRKVHNVVFMPSFEALEKFQVRLEKIGNIRSDGRPILGLDSRDLLEIVLETDPQGYLIPAHIWTPWFAMLGSMSGFDSVEECFGDLTHHIFALETGLSSDPPMNWRLSILDKYTLVSNSDAHSPPKLMREANLFDTELAYDSIFDALKSGDPSKFLGTLEFFPEEGKYHYDGHRKCRINWDPRTTLAHEGICSECGRKVTVGVMHRVETLADRDPGCGPPKRHPFKSLVPLPEVLAEIHGVGPNSKRVQQSWTFLLTRLGSELHILQDAPFEEIRKYGGEMVEEGIRRMRAGEIHVTAGYDGEFGVIKFFEENERKSYAAQLGLFIENVKVANTLPNEVADPDREVNDPMRLPFKRTKSNMSHETEAEKEAKPDSLAPELDPNQTSAVQHEGSALLISAGPGTGKTRTLTHRVAYLIQERSVNPEQILCLTFTNKAAEEMRKRLLGIVGETRSKHVTVNTFHALGAKILSEHGSYLDLSADTSICGESDCLDLLARIAPSLSQRQRQKYADAIASAKRNLIAATEVGKHHDYDDLTDLGKIYDAYEELKRKQRLFDFGDLLYYPNPLLSDHHSVKSDYQARFPWIFVDEYQDVNFAQYKLLRHLAGPASHLCVIGDPNQAIYGFRGATSEYFKQFAQEYPRARTVHLEKNYRSAQAILAASSQVLDNPCDKSKLWSEIVGEKKLLIYSARTDKAEAEYIVHTIEKMVGGTSYFSIDSGRVTDLQTPTSSFRDFAVLYRLRSQSKVLAEAFDRSGMPFQTAGQIPFHETEPVRTVTNYLWLLLNPHDLHHLQTILNGKFSPFAKATSASLSQALRASDAPWIEIIKTWQTEKSRPGARQKSIQDFMQKIRQFSQALPDLDVVDLVREVAENFTPRKLSAATESARKQVLDKLYSRARPFGRDLRAFLLDLALATEADDVDPRADRVTLSTLHAAKGLEFQTVFIAGCEKGLVPFERENQILNQEEERRLLYVGMTRARHKLILTYARKRLLFGKILQRQPSPFLNDIEVSLRNFQKNEPRKLKIAAPEDEQIKLF